MGYEIRSEQELREVITGAPHELVVTKDTSVITESIKRYIDRSPFVCLATHGADGSSDVSPRGDAPGFVHVLDEKTLLIPDRPGNKRLELPKIVIVVTVTEALGHCSKAFRRSKLWQSDYLPDAGIPSLAELMSDHLGLDAATSQILELGIDDDVRNNMY
jgi:predicted pyridoxine 5'-phosphate oxidase superfamily flavin-nucleotide-binding protein